MPKTSFWLHVYMAYG